MIIETENIKKLFEILDTLEKDGEIHMGIVTGICECIQKFQAETILENCEHDRHDKQARILESEIRVMKNIQKNSDKRFGVYKIFTISNTVILLIFIMVKLFLK